MVSKNPPCTRPSALLTLQRILLLMVGESRESLYVIIADTHSIICTLHREIESREAFLFYY